MGENHAVARQFPPRADALRSALQHCATMASIRPAPEVSVKALIDYFRRACNLGPMILYVREQAIDHATLGAAGPHYRPWHTSGVRISSPMYGILPEDSRAWLVDASTNFVVDAHNHAETRRNRPSEFRFWTREGVTSYYKTAIPGLDSYLIFNTSVHQDRTPLSVDVLPHLRDFAALLGPLLPAALEASAAREEATLRDARHRLARLRQLIMHHWTRMDEPLLLSELLQDVHGMFAGRGAVFGNLMRVVRQRDVNRGESYLALREECKTGVPHSWTRDIEEIPVRARPADGDGILSWVVHHNASLMIDDFAGSAQDYPELPLRRWYKRLWKDVRSEIAVPIRSESGAQVLGALNFESRAAHAFSPMDVRLLEQCSVCIGEAMQAARQRRVVTTVFGFARLPDEASLSVDESPVARELADFQLADSVTIWAQAMRDEPPTVCGRYYRDGLQPESTVARLDGETRRLLDVDDFTAHLALVSYAQDGTPTVVWKQWKQARGAFPGEWRDAQHTADISPLVVERRYATILGIPLRVEGRAHEKPVGVVWTHWHRWRDHEEHLIPTNDDMIVMREVAAGLAPLIGASKVIEGAMIAGVGHDWLKYAWSAASAHAATLHSRSLEVFLDLASSLQQIYRSAVDLARFGRGAEDSRLVVALDPRRSTGTGWYGLGLREVLLSAVGFASSAFAAIDELAGAADDPAAPLAGSVSIGTWQVLLDDANKWLLRAMPGQDVQFVARCLQVVLVNLCVNAQRASPTAPKAVELEVTQPNPPDLWLHIKVKNRVVGAAEEEAIANVKRALQSRSTLVIQGLVLVKNLLALMGGAVDVTDEPAPGGQAATICVHLSIPLLTKRL